MSQVDLEDLERALKKYSTAVEDTVKKSMQVSARFGLAAVIKTARKTKDPFRIRASGTYEASFFVKDTDDGAVVSNSAKHAVFVERGRRPGKMPPAEVILEWMKEKKMVRASRKKGEKKESKEKKAKKKTSKKKRSKSKLIKKKDAPVIAMNIARKIGKKGTKGRWVFRRSMARIAKFTRKDLRKRLSTLNKNPPV